MNLSNMPAQTCDVGTQCPDHIEHNYSFSCGNKAMKDCGTQTDPIPSVSAHSLTNKDFIFYCYLLFDMQNAEFGQSILSSSVPQLVPCSSYSAAHHMPDDS